MRWLQVAVRAFVRWSRVAGRRWSGGALGGVELGLHCDFGY